jgi:uncharacterized protein
MGAVSELGRGSGGSTGIVFFGGEPLLHKPLIQWTVRRAREMTRAGAAPFHFKLTTNGLALDQAFIEYAVESDLAIALSFDGVAEAHDRHRRLADGSPSFQLVRQKLELLLAYMPYASVLMVVNPDTVRWLAESVCFLVDRGCRYLVVSLNYGADWERSALTELEDQYQRLAELYLQWTRAGRKFYLSPFEVKIASHVQGDAFGRDRCALGQRQLSVDPAGYLYPCVQFTRAGPNSAWCIGHVRSGVDGERLSRVRAAACRRHEPCSDCAVEHRCNHTCGCLNWQATGSTETPSPVLCRNEQLLIPIADRIAETLYRERNPLFLHKHYNAAYPILSLLEDGLVDDDDGQQR